MKTKYIAVPVSERLPEKSGVYLASWKTTDGSEAWKTSMFIDYDDGCRNEWRLYVECFYEPVPDHSEEMLSMLEGIVDAQYNPETTLSEMNIRVRKAKEFLNKVKDNGKYTKETDEKTT